MNSSKNKLNSKKKRLFKHAKCTLNVYLESTYFAEIENFLLKIL